MGFEEDLAEGMTLVGAPTDGMDVGVVVDTEDDRVRLHQRNVAHIETYVRARLAHQRNVPDCNAAPVCNGPGAAMAIAFRSRIQHGYLESLMYSAIALLSERDAEVADLRAQLMGMDADLVDARGNLADTERQLFDAQARLAACDDMLGSAVPPVVPND
jgi:hypothetical protein